MREERRRAIRLAALANVALGVLALLSVRLAERPAFAFSVAGWVGIGLILWGSVDAWAAWSGRVRGTKVLAMFMAILGMVLAGSSFLIQDAGPYRWVSIVLGAFIIAVSVADAVISPGDRRRRTFGPGPRVGPP